MKIISQKFKKKKCAGDFWPPTLQQTNNGVNNNASYFKNTE